MRLKMLAALSLFAWIIASSLLLPQALRLEERLVYSEEHLVPRDIESYRALEVLRSIGEAPESSYIIAIYRPVTLETSQVMESRLREALRDWDPVIIGPWSVYSKVISEAKSRLAGVLENASKAYQDLGELAQAASEAYTELRRALNLTYGIAYAYMEAYNFAAAMGLADPSRAAYEALRQALPEEARPFLDEFYKALQELTGGKPEREALEEAARAAAGKLLPPEVAGLVARFGLGNYTDGEAVAAVVYEESTSRGVNLSLDEFKELIRDPAGAPERIVASRLSSAVPCLVDAFKLLLQGFPPEEAVDEACRGYLESTLPFPDAIPEDVRDKLVSGGYGFIYVYTRKSVEVNESIEVMESLESSPEGVEVYYYGSIPLFAEVAVNAERETARIDVATAVLVTILLIVLLGSLSAPAVILAGASAALAVSMGLLSIAAERVSVYYLARVLVIPVVFGVTVDYSVFYLFRIMEEYGRARSWGEAVSAAWRRASRALTLGGVAVVLGFLAYTLTPQEALKGIGVALVIAAGVSFASSLTLLPAILAILGPRGAFWPRASPRIPAAGQALLFRRLAAASVRRGPLLTIAMLAATLALAVYLAGSPPSANLHFSLSEGSQYMEAARLLYETLPTEYYSRLEVVAPAGPGSGEVAASLEPLGLRVLDVREAGGYIIVNVGLPVDPLDDRVFEIVSSVRSALPPEAMVDGFPALRVDAVDSILGDFFKVTIPLASALILAYLIAGYGSVLVPLRLLATVAFSAAASLFLTALAFTPAARKMSEVSYMGSPIYWIVPIIVLGLMVTLGMDYDIFLTTRIREEMEHGKPQEQAILDAVERTGVVITVCGLILAGAFSTLLLTRVPTLREAGLAVALSILIDTFIVRPILVPAVMSTLGKYNWWPGKSLFKRWD